MDQVYTQQRNGCEFNFDTTTPILCAELISHSVAFEPYVYVLPVHILLTIGGLSVALSL